MSTGKLPQCPASSQPLRGQSPQARPQQAYLDWYLRCLWGTSKQSPALARFSADVNATRPVAAPSSSACSLDRVSLKLPSSCYFLLPKHPSGSRFSQRNIGLKGSSAVTPSHLCSCKRSFLREIDLFHNKLCKDLLSPLYSFQNTQGQTYFLIIMATFLFPA